MLYWVAGVLGGVLMAVKQALGATVDLGVLFWMVIEREVPGYPSSQTFHFQLKV